MAALQHLMDRIAISLGADVPTDFEQRVAAVDSARRFQVLHTALPLQPLPACSKEPLPA